MSVTPQPRQLEGTAREKSDKEDHDLLTFGEAAERLRIEIATSVATVAQLQTSGTPDELARAQARLAALRAAASRNSAPAIDDANFEKFFGYSGKAERSLGGRPAAE